MRGCCMQDYEVQQLEVGYETGEDRLCLWLPMIGRHLITEASPLASWITPTGFMADADSHIVVVVGLSLPQHPHSACDVPCNFMQGSLAMR